MFMVVKRLKSTESDSMADQAIPYFKNDKGVPSIRIGAHRFMCVGASPPFDHPHIFLDMGSDREIVCPYCSTLFKYDGTLHGAADPGDCVYDAHKAA
jgi:uncharacterized Zn-finger protein